MSTNATIWAWKVIRAHKLLDAKARFVLLALADRHNQATGRCDPSIECISNDIGISTRSVQSALRELENGKFIKTRHRKIPKKPRNYTNLYEFRDVFRGAGAAPPKMLEPKGDTRALQDAPRRPSNTHDVVYDIETFHIIDG